MPEFDLAICGGTVATAADTFRADVGIRDGRIAAVADKVEGARREIDARRLLVLPGGIDSHVHLAQPSGPEITPATTSPPAPPQRRRAANVAQAMRRGLSPQGRGAVLHRRRL